MVKIYYKVIHKYKLIDHIEKKHIGIFSNVELAEDAIEILKKEPGFNLTQEGFKITKIIRLTKPKYLNIVFWKYGFHTYEYNKKKNTIIKKTFEETLLEEFEFLFLDYGFKYQKVDLGNAIDKNGKFFFYGPVYCYYIYNDNICINILNLVQRQDYNIFITKDKSDDQAYIRKGLVVADDFAYNIGLFATNVKLSIESTGALYGYKINKK